MQQSGEDNSPVRSLLPRGGSDGESFTCEHTSRPGSCPNYDDDPCNDGECENKVCVPVPLTGPQCPGYEEDPCNDGQCQEGACVSVPTPGPCDDDGNECTNDLCQNGSCAHPPLDGAACQDDGDLCTDDICENGACTHPQKCPISDGPCEKECCGSGVCYTHVKPMQPSISKFTSGIGCPGSTVTLNGVLCNGGPCDRGFDLTYQDSGTATIASIAGPSAMSVPGDSCQGFAVSVTIDAASPPGTATITVTATNTTDDLCNGTLSKSTSAAATVTVCDQCETSNGTQCEPKALCTSCTPQGTTSCSPAGYACDGSGSCERGQNLIPQILGQLGIAYAYQSTLGCSAGQCGARIRFDVTGITHSCDSIDMEGASFTESVTSDAGCIPGGVTTGPGCPVSCGNCILGCTDTYWLCSPPSDFPPGGCMETYTQNLYVDGRLAETHTIVFTITFPGGTCTGSVIRN